MPGGPVPKVRSLARTAQRASHALPHPLCLMDPLVGFQGVLSLEAFPTLKARNGLLIGLDTPVAEQKGSVGEAAAVLCVGVRCVHLPKEPLVEAVPVLTSWCWRKFSWLQGCLVTMALTTWTGRHTIHKGLGASGAGKALMEPAAHGQ